MMSTTALGVWLAATRRPKFRSIIPWRRAAASRPSAGRSPDYNGWLLNITLYSLRYDFHASRGNRAADRRPGVRVAAVAVDAVKEHDIVADNAK